MHIWFWLHEPLRRKPTRRRLGDVRTLNSLTLSSLLERSLELFAERPALALVGGEQLTYQELVRRIRWVQNRLHATGFAPGDPIAILSQNLPNWAVVYLAVTTMGGVVVPLLPDFSKAEIRSMLEHCCAKGVFASRGLMPKVPGSDDLLVVGIEEFAGLEEKGDLVSPSGPEVSEVPEGGGRRNTESGEAGNRPDNGLETGRLGAQHVPREHDLAAIIYTSGTTGSPKGVMLTHHNIVSNVEVTRPLADAVPGERALSILPLAHTYECTIGLLAPLSAGMCVHYLGEPPAPTRLLPALESVRPHLVLSVPLIIEKIYRARVAPILRKNAVLRALCRIAPVRKTIHRLIGRKLVQSFGGELRFFGLGGAPVAPDVERFLFEARFPYGVGYGLTETSPLLAASSPWNQALNSTGPAVEGVELRIANPDPETGEGELQARGPNVMRGYYRDPERTDAAFTSDGWFRTGDLGFIDKRGYVFIRGRVKNMIVKPDGKKVYPEELESLINAQPFVSDSLVTEDSKQLVALIHLDLESFQERIAGGRPADPGSVREAAQEYLEELRGHVNTQLPTYARVARFSLKPEPFEKTPTMKIKRYLYDSPTPDA